MKLRTLIFAALCCQLAACGGDQRNAVVAGPPIAGLNLNGLWYCTEFGDMRLTQQGNLVTGSYEDPRGPDHNGTLRGNIEGDLIHMVWIKPGNPLAAIMSQQGKGWLRISQDGHKLDGMWGYGDQTDDGGPWHAEKSQF